MPRQIDYKDVDPLVWLLVAYKPSSNDFCRGCLMASYESDFEIYEFDNPDELVEKATKLTAQYAFMKAGEAGYQLTIIRGVKCVDAYKPLEGLIEEINTKADQTVEAEKERLKVLAGGQRRQKVDADANKELAELARLQAKYKPEE